MHEVCVTYDFDAPPEQVFAGISHHVEFLGTSNIQCRMLRLGENDANGKGALREVRKGMICFEEAITAFEPPQAYQYRIISLRGPFNLRLPFHHEHGRLELHQHNQTTRLIWHTRFRFQVPLIGHWIEKKLGKSISASFVFFLKRLDGRLQQSSSNT